MIKILVVD